MTITFEKNPEDIYNKFVIRMIFDNREIFNKFVRCWPKHDLFDLVIRHENKTGSVWAINIGHSDMIIKLVKSEYE